MLPAPTTPDANRPLMVLRSDNTNSPTVTDDSGSSTSIAARPCGRGTRAGTSACATAAAKRPCRSGPVIPPPKAGVSCALWHP